MAHVQKSENYSKAVNTKYPEQVVIAIATDEKRTPNPITLGWTMITSHKPPMMAISIAFTRYSYNVIKQAGEFVISFPGVEMAEDALFFGTRSGRDLCKIAEFGTATEPCEKIDCVIFSDAVANFECRLAGELESGDHAIFTGEVLQSWVNPESTERLYTVGSGYQMGRAAGEKTVEYSKSLFD